MVDQALKALDGEFGTLCPVYGRESIAPEKLLRAQLLMALYTIRSERQPMEQIDYKVLFVGSRASRWMTRSGITRRSQRIETACSAAMWLVSFSLRYWFRLSVRSCYRRSTSASMTR
jgi:hypothetical protein